MSSAKKKPTKKAATRKAATSKPRAKAKAKAAKKVAKKAAGKKAASKKSAARKAPVSKAAKKASAGRKAPAAAAPAPAVKSSAAARSATATAPSSEVAVMPGASRHGTKYACFKCGAKFYDLNRPEPLCPKCGADQRSRPKPQRKGAPAKDPHRAAVRPIAPLLDDEEETTSRDVDEDMVAALGARADTEGAEDFFDDADIDLDAEIESESDED